MFELKIPAFGEKCSEYKESRNARSVYIPCVWAEAFAVQFISDRPVVISHRDHTASYHSTIN